MSAYPTTPRVKTENPEMITQGQKLWMVFSQRYCGEPREVTVIKVGRKWAEIDVRGYRIDKTTLAIDGGDYTSPGRCYLCRETYERRVALLRAWNAVASKIDRRYGPADGVTIDDVRAAAALLKVNLED
jgi:hypothetical protein